MDKNFLKGFLSGAGVTTGIGVTLISFVLIGFFASKSQKTIATIPCRFSNVIYWLKPKGQANKEIVLENAMMGTKPRSWWLKSGLKMAWYKFKGPNWIYYNFTDGKLRKDCGIKPSLK